MQRTRFIFALGILAIAGALHASTFGFSTPAGAQTIGVNGDPLAASAIFTVSANTITITLNNLEANPTTDAQVLDALTFQLNGQTIPGGATINLSMSETKFIKVTNGGSDPQTSATLSWNLSDQVTGSTVDFSFCNAIVTGTNCTSAGTDAPAGGIIGAAASNNKYTNADSTIRGSSANPYIFEDASFAITMSSGTFNLNQSNYTNLLFGYGDTTNEYEAVGGVAPEPSSFWMIAAALALGLAAFPYRHKLRA